MNDTMAPAKPKLRKKRRNAKSSTQRRRSRYEVAALQAAYRVARDEKAHFSYRLEACRIIVALENGLGLQLKITGHDLRRAIKEEIARGDVSEQLSTITGIVRKIEQDHHRGVAPTVESNQQVEAQEPVLESAPPPEPVSASKSDSVTESLREALRRLEAGEAEVSVVPVAPKTPALPSAAKLAPPAPTEPYLSKDELAAINEFAQLRIGVSELETELKPFLKIEWVGLDRDRITSVSLTGARIAPEDRVTISSSLMERAQNVAMSPSPRDQQLVREWIQVITKTPFFAVGSDILKEVIWLKQQMGL